MAHHRRIVFHYLPLCHDALLILYVDLSPCPTRDPTLCVVCITLYNNVNLYADTLCQCLCSTLQGQGSTLKAISMRGGFHSRRSLSGRVSNEPPFRSLPLFSLFSLKGSLTRHLATLDMLHFGHEHRPVPSPLLISSPADSSHSSTTRSSSSMSHHHQLLQQHQQKTPPYPSPLGFPIFHTDFAQDGVLYQGQQQARSTTFHNKGSAIPCIRPGEAASNLKKQSAASQQWMAVQQPLQEQFQQAPNNNYSVFPFLGLQPVLQNNNNNNNNAMSHFDHDTDSTSLDFLPPSVTGPQYGSDFLHSSALHDATLPRECLDLYYGDARGRLMEPANNNTDQYYQLPIGMPSGLDHHLPQLSLNDQAPWSLQTLPDTVSYNNYSQGSKESSPVFSRGGDDLRSAGTVSVASSSKKKARSASFGQESNGDDDASSVLFRPSKKKQSVDPSVYGFTTESALLTDPLKFDKAVILFLRDQGKPVSKMPSVDKKWLSFWSLFHGTLFVVLHLKLFHTHTKTAVHEYGGFQAVTKSRKWKQVAYKLMLPKSLTSASYTLRTFYTKYLQDFERFYMDPLNKERLDIYKTADDLYQNFPAAYSESLMTKFLEESPFASRQ